jgi:hypothetical protein
MDVIRSSAAALSVALLLISSATAVVATIDVWV